jgi:putative ABC transport system substrate-binding protein
MQASRILIAGFLSFAAVVGVTAAEPKHVPQVGYLSVTLHPLPADYDPSKDPWRAALLEGLRAFGYVEGQNVHLDFRIPRMEDAAETARDLVNRNVDVIAAAGAEAVEAARRATSTIPIVIVACDHADWLVANIARPGGNVTGMTCVSSDLAAKRLQLLQEVVPGISRVSVLFNGGDPGKVDELHHIQAAASTMQIQVQPTDVRDPSGFAAAFAAIKSSNAQALLPLTETLTVQYRREIAAFAAEQHLPSMYGFREFCDAGGLLCYGANLKEQFRHYGYFIDKILKGTKAGDIPIEQPLKLELVVNVRTAKSLGLSLPSSILMRADHEIE